MDYTEEALKQIFERLAQIHDSLARLIALADATDKTLLALSKRTDLPPWATEAMIEYKRLA
jgi:hypothetical protein